MSRPCTVCSSSHRQAVDAALLAGEAYRGVAARFSLPPNAVYRHRCHHLPVALRSAIEERDASAAESLLDQVHALQGRAMNILAAAEDAGDLRVALMAIREARSGMELMAKLLGKLNEGNTVNVNVDAEWPRLRAIVLQALEPYPEAKGRLVVALSEMGAC